MSYNILNVNLGNCISLRSKLYVKVFATATCSSLFKQAYSKQDVRRCICRYKKVEGDFGRPVISRDMDSRPRVDDAKRDGDAAEARAARR